MCIVATAVVAPLATSPDSVKPNVRIKENATYVCLLFILPARRNNSRRRQHQ
jgi:hypothetical protein